MAILSEVFTDQERTKWLKAWLGADIANLLKCPLPRLCNKRGASSICTSFHDAAEKQPRPCPFRICDKVLDEIKLAHRYGNPSWKNTSANDRARYSWQIAKCYLPPDGYAGKRSVQKSYFNGIISFMINCTYFDIKFSFPIDPAKGSQSCLLTKARDIGRKVRHTSQCKFTDTELQDIITTLTSLLTDPTSLAHDVAAQEAESKLAKLQTDSLKITTEEMMQILKGAQDTIEKIENLTDETLCEISVYFERYRIALKEEKDKHKQELEEHTSKLKYALDEYCRKSAETNYLTEDCYIDSL